MKKVSFDFDNTLDFDVVQEFALSLIKNGIDVWIHSARFPESDVRPKWNDDIYKVSDKLGIPRHNIILTEMYDKYIFLEDEDFIWHLDDKKLECKTITKKIDTKGIHFNKYDKNLEWKDKCIKLLNKKRD